MAEDKEGIRLVERWRKELSREKRAHQKWRDFAEKVEKCYYDGESKNQSRLNVFFANVQIQHAALLANAPQPEVRRRHQNAGEAEKNAAMMVEEALSYIVDTEPFKGPVDLALEDALVPGMGVVRINYDPQIEMQVIGVDEMGMPVEAPGIADQRLSLEFFSSQHFHWQPAKRWEDVDWIAFDFKMTRKEISEQWDVDLDEYQGEVEDDEKSKATVTEIWDKKRKQVVVICQEHKEPLEVREDALGLRGFFPMPEPLVPYRERTTFTPLPEFYHYEKLQKQLENLAERHDSLVSACKDRGVADGALAEQLSQLSRAKDGALIPVPNLLAELNAAGGRSLSDLIHHWPIENVVRVLAQVKDEIEFVKRQTYELTGISDIVRGASQASETATAQQIKGQWANVRLVRKQNALNRFVRDIFRIMSEIVCEHFQPQILAGMTSLDEQEVAQALPLVQSDMQRQFVIDVETDSTIARDEHEERELRLQMLDKLTMYMQTIPPLVQSGYVDAGMAKEVMLSVVRSWKHGRQLEEYVLGMDGTAEQFQKMQQGFQQQMQQVQQQMAQMQQQLQQVVAERDQYAKQVQQFDAAEAQRESVETQASAAEDMADARYKDAQTEQLRAQTAIQQIYPAA